MNKIVPFTIQGDRRVPQTDLEYTSVLFSTPADDGKCTVILTEDERDRQIIFDLVLAGIETGSDRLKQRVPASELSDDQMAELLALFDAWEDIAEGATIPEGKHLTYQSDALYRCITEHDKQATWTPASAHSLFAFETIPGVVDEWTQPGSTNPYLMHAVVTRNGTVYLSLHEDNVWDPEAVGEDIWMTLGPESDIDQILADLDDTIANL